MKAMNGLSAQALHQQQARFCELSAEGFASDVIPDLDGITGPVLCWSLLTQNNTFQNKAGPQ